MRIELSQGKFALIDEADKLLVDKYKWSYQLAYKGKDRNCEYAISYSKGSHSTRKRIYLHRLIMNNPLGMMIDHKNGDGLDCRRENMRVCTNSQNQANRAARKGKKYSDLKGVSFYKNSHKWMSSIRVNGKNINLGTFNSEKEAFNAYKLVAKNYFGEFSNLVFA